MELQESNISENELSATDVIFTGRGVQDVLKAGNINFVWKITKESKLKAGLKYSNYNDITK